MKARPFQFSIKRAKKCTFCRRTGHLGKVIFGYSIVLTLFNIRII